MVSMALLAAVGTLWFSSRTSSLSVQKKASDFLALVTEHRSVSGWIETISRNAGIVAAQLKLDPQPPTSPGTAANYCYPHPYSRLDGDHCINVTLGGQSPVFSSPSLNFSAALTSWKALSDAMLEWLGDTKANLSAGSSYSLDPAVFESKIKPKLQAAGCMNCHGGGGLTNASVCTSAPGAHRQRTYPAELQAPTSWNSTIGLTQQAHNSDGTGYVQANFNCYDEVARSFAARNPDGSLMRDSNSPRPALVDLNLVGSPLGSSLLQREFMIKSFGSNNSQTESRVNLSLQTFEAQLPANHVNMRTAVDAECQCEPSASGRTYPTGVRCKTLNRSEPPSNQDPNPPVGYFCRNREAFSAGSCRDSCIQYEPPQYCSCGKNCSMICTGFVPRCIKYKSTYACNSEITVQNFRAPSVPIPNSVLGTMPAVQTSVYVAGLAPLTKCQSFDHSTGDNCGGVTCESLNGAPGNCVETRAAFGGYCRAKCVEPTFTATSCGKNCVQQVQSACRAISLDYLCFTQFPPTIVSTKVVQYSISSSMFRRLPGAAQRELITTHTMQGVLAP